MSSAAQDRERVYRVDLTVRETVSVRVRASNQKQARERALSTFPVEESWHWNDRTVTGVKGVARDDDE